MQVRWCSAPAFPPFFSFSVVVLIVVLMVIPGTYLFIFSKQNVDQV